MLEQELRPERVDIYGGQDPQVLPLYSYADASRYLKIPQTTVRYWAKGGFYTRDGAQGFFSPVLSAPDKPLANRLSFLNLTELYVLKALRVKHGVQLRAIRQALEFASQTYDIERPLLRDLLVHSGEIFIEHYATLINLNRSGQIALECILAQHLERLEWDAQRERLRIHPLVEGLTSERFVTLDPRVSFGKPTVYGTGIHTRVISSRFDAGESAVDIADDYGLPLDLIKGAIVYEGLPAA